MRCYTLQDLVSLIPSSHYDNVKFVLLLVIILPSLSLIPHRERQMLCTGKDAMSG